MAYNLISTRELTGVRVIAQNGTRKVGKIRSFVFHPQAKRCVGYLVQRPDLLLMFRRKDLFVAIDGCNIVDGRMVINNDGVAIGKAACRRLGVSWDECVLWLGLPVMCQDGTAFGQVGSVTFDSKTGDVRELEIDAGLTENALLGKRVVPTNDILGFRRGLGTRLASSSSERFVLEHINQEENVDLSQFGAIVVSDDVKYVEAEGGLVIKAEQAGEMIRVKTQNVITKVQPAVDEATRVAGEVVNKGAFALGRQLGHSKGMFAAFKAEYTKARRGDAPSDSSKHCN